MFDFLNQNWDPDVFILKQFDAFWYQDCISLYKVVTLSCLETNADFFVSLSPSLLAAGHWNKSSLFNLSWLHSEMQIAFFWGDGEPYLKSSYSHCYMVPDTGMIPPSPVTSPRCSLCGHVEWTTTCHIPLISPTTSQNYEPYVKVQS